MIHRYNCPLLLQILLLFFANNISNVQAGVSCGATTCANGKWCTFGASCLACPAGTELLLASETDDDLTNQGKCTTCEAGKTSTAGLVECTDCSSGMYSISTTNHAFSTYGLDARETCKNCVVGTKFASKSTACAICAAGTYQNQNDQAPAVCSDCADGKYLVDDATAAIEHDSPDDCLICVVGTQFVDKITLCSICAAGKYQNLNTQAPALCSSCPTGKYLLDTATDAALHDALLDCSFCLVGTEFVDQTTACQICAAGKYQHLNIQASTGTAQACSNCPTGKYLLDTATDAALHDALLDCLFCLVGTEFVDKTTSCTICDAGKYQSSNSQGNPAAQCTFCAAGTYYVDKVSSCPT
jgi:hypothetical protein